MSTSAVSSPADCVIDMIELQAKEDCYICLEKTEIPEKVAQFACNVIKHNACNDCFKIYKKKKCPICRKEPDPQPPSLLNRTLSVLNQAMSFLDRSLTPRDKSFLFCATISSIILGSAIGGSVGYAITGTMHGAGDGGLIGLGCGVVAIPITSVAYLKFCYQSRLLRV